MVQWSTVRLILNHTLINGWTTKQVNYTNAFAQAELSEDVYIERPRGFPRIDGKDMVLKLNKSLFRVYVDDMIICGPDSKEIEKLIVNLGVSNDEHMGGF